MRTKIPALLPLLPASLLLAAGTVLARDTVLHYDFEADRQEAIAENRIDPAIRYYLAGNDPEGSVTRLDEVVTNLKTNANMKSDRAACRWVFFSNLIALEQHVKRAGANAVVDIVSWYRKKEFSSPTEYECHAGTWTAGVTFKGTLARVE